MDEVCLLSNREVQGTCMRCTLSTSDLPYIGRQVFEELGYEY